MMILDEHITLKELTSCFRAAKRGKAVLEDPISNEFFKTWCIPLENLDNYAITQKGK